MKVTMKQAAPVRTPLESLSLEDIKPEEARTLRMILLKVSLDSDPKFYDVARTIAGLLYVDPDTYVSEGALVDGKTTSIIFTGGKGKQ